MVHAARVVDLDGPLEDFLERSERVLVLGGDDLVEEHDVDEVEEGPRGEVEQETGPAAAVPAAGTRRGG